MSEQLVSLQEFSRSHFGAGRPALSAYDAQGGKVSLELVQAGAALRQAEALERIASSLELTNERHYQKQVAASLDTPTGRAVVHAFKERHGLRVNLEVDFSTRAAAARFFDNFSEHMKQVVDQANEQEGGQDV